MVTADARSYRSKVRNTPTVLRREEFIAAEHDEQFGRRRYCRALHLVAVLAGKP
jgi:hypothetical protein